MQTKFKFRFKLKFGNKELNEYETTILAATNEEAARKLLEAALKKIDIEIVSSVAEVHIVADSKQDAQEKSRQAINQLYFNPKDN